ncbi:MAG: ribose 5-phosphate isomerase B [Bacillota bacterium]|nr:MAG: ribose 5-phosphate isomerase B [Bacillota bacterium]
MKIAIACDHGGYELKEELKKHLSKRNTEYVDFGTDGTQSVDYPDYAEKAAGAVLSGECDFGIVICGTGIGISIAANKIAGIRCAHCHDVYSARMTRAHNDANMLAFGARVIGAGLMCEIVDAFLGGSFEGGRHQRRVDKITAIEKKYSK